MVGKRLGLLVAVSLSLVLMSSPLFAQWPPEDCNGRFGGPLCMEDPVNDPDPCRDKRGVRGEELVKALDAAYVRVLNPGYMHAKGEDSYWDIAEQEGIADKYNTTVFDCYPYVEETEFPEPTPGGLLECILQTGTIRFGKFQSSETCVGSSSVGTTAAERTLRAIVDEIGLHYGVHPIAIDVREFNGGRLKASMFHPLVCDCVDMISNVHSLGAVTEGALRREIMLHTCTIRASQHVLFVRQADWDSEKYRSVGDVVDDPTAEVCGGDLDNHVISSLFGDDRKFRADCRQPAPDPNPDPNGFHDIGVCRDRMTGDGTGEGESAVFFHWDSTLEIPGLKGILTPVVGGTPYWVKKPVPAPRCGNGRIDWKLGETCDEPGSICGSGGNPNWVCSDQCKCEFVRSP